MLLVISSVSFLLQLIAASPNGPGHGNAGYGSGYGSGYPHGPSSASPTVNVKNGTLIGRHSSEYNQDFFLGVPYAKPPTGENRFRVPQSINSSYSIRDATQYSNACVGYGSDQWPYAVDEDCLYLNIVRPSGYHRNLPVAFWIHGGGYAEGSGIDQRYNLSFIVQNSVKIGKPIIGVSINYRLSAWGFLQSIEMYGSGNTNLGLRDQRLALHWVQENIAAFGGDPSKVTIWGESAGGSSVGFHLIAYGGRDDKLFRGAMMESGNPVPYFSLLGDEISQPKFNTIAAATGCNSSLDKLECLRHIPFDRLNAAINTTDLATSFNPYIDGDFVEQFPSVQLAKGRFVRIPVVNGANSDEGVSFSPMRVNTTADFEALLSDLPSPYIQQVLEAYPDIPSQGIPASPPLGPLPPNFRYGPPFGAEFRRSAAYFGDQVFIANRRLTCQTWAAAGLSAYCYRFNAVPAGLVGIVPHFQEVAFVFYNLLGVGYVAPGVVPPFQGKGESYRELSRLMDSSWISFVHDLDPNSFRAGGKNGFSGVQPWPAYSLSKPQNFVFDANVTSHPEPDTWRAAGIKLINDNNAGVYHR